MALEFDRFAVSILRADQQELSEIFAGRTSEDDKRFKGVKTQMAPSCIPVSEGALAILDCQINQTIDAGTHTLFIALVEHSHVSDDTPPLLYFNRAYR
jgi:3-hydroxy-9,10-secoandrosta-1,3,5(10)-triene-9,17-dione monooxygenase reductase component